ncbi:MAG TPA: hypothetical protein VG347_03375 [Verrucomicrobiae bacterium]|nr:hypothetical protein [Verrucomicrobiae bacterium]
MISQEIFLGEGAASAPGVLSFVGKISNEFQSFPMLSNHFQALWKKFMKNIGHDGLFFERGEFWFSSGTRLGLHRLEESARGQAHSKTLREDSGRDVAVTGDVFRERDQFPVNFWHRFAVAVGGERAVMKECAISG